LRSKRQQPQSDHSRARICTANRHGRGDPFGEAINFMQNHDDSSDLPVPFKSVQGNPLSTPAQATLLASQQDDPSRDGVVAYWRMVQRHKWIVVLVALLGAMAGLLITLPQTPVYQSQTSLEVQGLN